MKNIYFLVIKKRWFLFLILMLMSLAMNLTLWNEASQFIRAYPQIQLEKEEAGKGSMELVYQPDKDETGRVKELSVAKQQELTQVLSRFYVQHRDKLFYNKFNYFQGREALRRLTSDNYQEILSNSFNLDDLLIRKITPSEIQKLEEDLKNTGIPIQIRSLQAIYQRDWAYYRNNILFGLGASLLFFLFNVILIRWILRMSMRICQDEIFVLRLVGARKKSILQHFSILLSLPIFLAGLGFVLMIQWFPLGVIWQDYLLLLVENILLVSFVLYVVKHGFKEVLDA